MKTGDRKAETGQVESSYWIKLLIELKKVKPAKVRLLLEEVDEILAITIASIKTTRRNAA